MGDERERAGKLFKQGLACSQSVLAGFGRRYGLDEQVALMLARPFGGGVGLGFPCGAVVGAMMVLGLSKGTAQGSDQQERYAAYKLSQEFARRFEQKAGSIWCVDLLGFDLGRPGGMERAREEKSFTTVCPRFVDLAAEILEEMLAEGQGGA